MSNVWQIRCLSRVNLSGIGLAGRSSSRLILIDLKVGNIRLIVVSHGHALLLVLLVGLSSDLSGLELSFLLGCTAAASLH